MLQPAPTSEPDERGERGERGEHGASPVGALMMLLALFMVLDLMVLGARVATAHHTLENAVRQGARQATLAQGSSSAATRGALVMDSNFDAATCQSKVRGVDASEFTSGGTVGVKATCKLALEDLSLLGLPYPALSVSIETSEVIDTYRAVE